MPTNLGYSHIVVKFFLQHLTLTKLLVSLSVGTDVKAKKNWGITFIIADIREHNLKLSRMRQHYECRKLNKPASVSDTGALDVSAYMNGTAARRIRRRVYLLKKCGIRSGSDLQTLMEVSGNQFLYEASMKGVLETNLEELPKYVPERLTEEMVFDFNMRIKSL